MIFLAFDNGMVLWYAEVFQCVPCMFIKMARVRALEKHSALLCCHEIPSAGYFQLWQPPKVGSGGERKKGAQGSLQLEDSDLVVCLFLFFQFTGKVGLHLLED